MLSLLNMEKLEHKNIQMVLPEVFHKASNSLAMKPSWKDLVTLFQQSKIYLVYGSVKDINQQNVILLFVMPKSDNLQSSGLVYQDLSMQGCWGCSGHS